MTIFRMFWFQHLLSGFRWYRRWYGGRWEFHCIDVCQSSMWLPMVRPRVWPEYRQPCSVGAPIVEDYPDKGLA
jgi:hypothetical protein